MEHLEQHLITPICSASSRFHFIDPTIINIQQQLTDIQSIPENTKRTDLTWSEVEIVTLVNHLQPCVPYCIWRKGWGNYSFSESAMNESSRKSNNGHCNFINFAIKILLIWSIFGLKQEKRKIFVHLGNQTQLSLNCLNKIWHTPLKLLP
jgi:hypothetical protein